MHQTNHHREAGELLTALGNSGLPEIVPYVQPYLQSNSESLRMDALNALRRVPGAEIDEVMSRRIETDPSSLVRTAGLIAVSERSPSVVVTRALDTSVRSDKDPQVRATELRTIVAWLPLEPSFRATLAWLAENETETSLREAAIAQLAVRTK